MNFRNQARSFLVHASTLARADVLASRIQQIHSGPWALVVAMHETPANLEAQLHRQLQWASQHFTIASLESFAGLWMENPRRKANIKPLLLLTFDDGRESNYTVAAPLLESFGGRGVFFIVPTFAECHDSTRALSFYRERINPGLDPGDENIEDWKPMNPTQVADLAARGHAIGNHTLTHQRLVGLTPEQLEREIGDSARKLSSWTGKQIEAFAWTFGWDAIDRNAWRTIRKYHRYCFSPCAGMVDSRDQPALLWRREIEARYSPDELRFSYSGLVDLWWRSRKARLRELLGAGLKIPPPNQ
jgi:peptidoglycan/xylan/chitin deacetylase (PgdA/CDA1 family)